MNDDNKYIHTYYSPFSLSNNQKDTSSGSEYDSEKQIVHCQENIILDLLFNQLDSF